jgi:UDP-N-acetylmuramyl pentapeptide phosphotransferase/UDP-N-acetylglucosamine-1-phosphate transferase
MFELLCSFAVSLGVTLRVVRSAKSHSLDHDLSGPQKFHALPVPRIGGVGILAGLLVGLGILWMQGSDAGTLGLTILACGIPAFAAGLVEDLTKRVRARDRMMAVAVSAGLAFWLVGAAISRTDIPGLDWLVTFTLGSALLTVFAVTGTANSVNIVDGFNGLASMCVVIMLAALGYVAFQVGDPVIGTLALVGVGAVLGFFFWNFPAGKVFLGDGGAYFLGFFVAELSILLLLRNPDVSPLFPLLVCFYPVFETVFSIYRRRVLRSLPTSAPDGIHLHSLIYRRVMRWAVGDGSAASLARCNSMTSPCLWLLCVAAAGPAVLFWNDSALLSVFLALFALIYVSLYWSIVRFQSPRWMHWLTLTQPAALEEGDNPGT